MNSPRPVPGMRDSRTFQARWNGSVTSARSRLGDADALVVDGHGERAVRTLAPTIDGRAVRGVLERIADEVRRAPGRCARRRRRAAAGRPGASTTSRSASPATSRSPRSRATSAARRRRRALEDQRVGLQVGHVEDLVDERGQAARGLVDALDVGALLLRREVQVEDRLGVPADERERRAQLVADGRDEPLAQLLEGSRGADVAQDRGRPHAAARRPRPRGIARRRRWTGEPAAPRTAVSR